MNKKTFESIIGMGLFVAFIFCSFLVCQGVDNPLSANSNSQTVTTLTGNELIDMFNLGLSKTKSGMSEDEMEQYYAMVEVAIQQCSLYPERIGEFWRLFENHLQERESVNPISRVAMIDLFVQQVEQCTNHCKSVEQFNQLWQTRKSIMAYRNSLICKEVEKALALLEKVDSSQMSQLLKKEINEQNLQYDKAYSLILEFSDDLPDDLSTRFDGIVQKFGTQLMTEIEDKLATLKQRYEVEMEKSKSTVIEPVCNMSTNNSTSTNTLSNPEFGIGVTYQLFTDIQSFTVQSLNSEIVQLLSVVEPNRIAKVQSQVTQLLEKTRILNQFRYNLWASHVIESADRVIQFDKMSLIAVEFLHPIVSTQYHKKIEKIMEASKNSQHMVANVSQMILNTKAPLSAF